MNDIFDPSQFREDADGSWVPIVNIKETDLLQDEMVVKIHQRAVQLNATLANFRAWALGEADALVDLLRANYDAKIGGAKGNVTFKTFDGRIRVQVAVQARLEFGPELTVAQELIRDCIQQWSDGANSNLVVLVDQAFKTDKEGKVSTERVLSLRRLKIEDPTWQRAMVAIGDAIRTGTSKRYVRIHVRNDADGSYTQLPLDVASAEIPVPEPVGVDTAAAE